MGNTGDSNMKIVVIGGSGLIGKKVVTNLRQHGHEVVAASPSSGVNTVTGEGLAKALAGAQVVVDVANAPSWEDNAVLAFFETSGRNLLAAEAAAGIGHHVALSVVGTDRLLASGYFRAKLAQEKLIKGSPIPYTIVRATQFFEFVGGIAQAATEGQTVRLPPVLMQPIVSDDVAAVMADVALAEPMNGTFEPIGSHRFHASGAHVCPRSHSGGEESSGDSASNRSRRRSVRRPIASSHQSRSTGWSASPRGSRRPGCRRPNRASSIP